MNMKISGFIADPTLVSQVIITRIFSDEMLQEKDMLHSFNQFSGLEEVAIVGITAAWTVKPCQADRSGNYRQQELGFS
jgi:hypothetical protein